MARKTYFKTITQEGKRLDELVLEEYGDLEKFEMILELNPSVQSAVFVPQGTVLTFIVKEVQEESVVKTVKAKELW